jgi:hypothetical protein
MSTFPGGMGIFECPQNEFLVFEDGPSVDVTLQWATYRDASDQCSLSRIWGGIHPPVDDIPGRLIGLVIGPEVFELAESYFYNDEDGDGAYSYCDCNDDDNTIYPGAPELCDGKDNDCNDLVDDGIPVFTYYLDADNDGYGDAAFTLDTCDVLAPVGYADNDLDCDDSNDMINPDAVEVCDEIDNNCNGMIDDGLTVYSYFVDNDNDGFGNADMQLDTCADTAPMGYVINDEDCDDENETVYPGAPELADGIDNDCNGIVDAVVEFEAEGWEVYPNPVLDVLIAEQDFFTNGMYQILSVDGKLLKTGAVNFAGQQGQVDFKGIPEGSYMIVFFDDEGNRRYIGKVTKL